METVRQDSVSVGITKVEIFSYANPNSPRKFLYVRNNSTGGQIITLSFGDSQSVAAGKGIVLNPTGSYYETKSEDFEPWQDRIYVISDLAGGTISVVER